MLMLQETSIFFDSWSKIGRSLLLALLAYLSLVFLLRIAGKRTLSKLNVFDFVFVVALGSTLATTILSSQTSLADGLTAFIVLIALQIILSVSCIYSHRVDAIVNGEPSLLMHQGRFLEDTMKRERVTKEEILASLRNNGVHTYDVVDSVVLETDGTFSIVWREVGGNCSSLIDVKGHPDYAPKQAGRQSIRSSQSAHAAH